MKKSTTTLLILLAFIVGLTIGKRIEEKKQMYEHDKEIKAYHTSYLKYHPFEGDASYEEFDDIFGHQDDEFYTYETNSKSSKM